MTAKTIGVQRERLPFTMLENDVFLDEKLSKNEKMVYWCLCFHADREGKCYPSLATICKESNISRGAIIGCLKSLAKRGYLSVASRLDPAGDRASNLYVIKALKGVVQSRNYPVQPGNYGVVQPGNGGSSNASQELYPLNKTKKNTLSPPAPVSAKRKPSAEEYPPGFESLWAAYPRQKEKKAALAKWRATIKKGASEAELLAAAEAYAADCRLKGTEERYVKHPATFLGPAEPWRDWTQKKDSKPRTADEIGAALFGRTG
jgi:hypothetical protein